MPIVRLVASILPTSNTSSSPRTSLSGDRVLEHRIADAIQLGKRQQQEAEEHATSHGTQPVGAMPHAIQEILGPVQNADECQPGKTTQDPEDRVEAELPGGHDVERGQREERLVAERRTSDDVRGHRGEHDGTEGSRRRSPEG